MELIGVAKTYVESHVFDEICTLYYLTLHSLSNFNGSPISKSLPSYDNMLPNINSHSVTWLLIQNNVLWNYSLSGFFFNETLIMFIFQSNTNTLWIEAENYGIFCRNLKSENKKAIWW